ncbi:MAG: peptidylprolyl isomerase [Bacteroidota bacterium]
MRASYFLIIVVLLGCSAQVAMNNASKNEVADQILFTVADSPVAVEEFNYVYKKNNINNDSAYTKTDVDDYLNLYINFKLKIEEAKSRGMDTTKAFWDEFNTYKEQLKKPYLTETKVTDSLAREAYSRMLKEINASHILIKVSENADPKDTLKAYRQIMEIREKAISGQDFGELAKKYSEDPSAQTNSGNLGYFTSFQMVYPFESAAYNTAVGTISKPVRTRFGYHIIKVLNSREAQGTVEVSHIMVRVKPTREDSAVARNKIFEIHEKALGGVPWKELASQFSEDINTKNKAGKLRPFSVGQMPSFEFQEASFELDEIGSISDPFMTQYGWHIVRLEKKSPVKPFADLEKTIRSRIDRDARAKVNKKVLIDRLKKENNFSLVTAINEVQNDYFDTLLVSGRWEKQQLRSEENVELFKIGVQSYKLQDFFNFAEANQKNNSYELPEYVQLLYNDFESEKIIQYEDAQLENKYLDYRMLVREYKEGILLFQLMEKEIWAKAVKDTAGLDQFFNLNRNNYQWKERIQATIYNASEKSIIEELKNRVENDERLENKVLDSLYNSESTIALQIDSGRYEREQKPLLNKVPWEVGIFEVAEQGRYNLVVIEKVIAAGPKELNETKGIVISDYQNELEERWLRQLRSKYSVVVNKKGKEAVYDELL